MTLALMGNNLAERLTDRDWPESTASMSAGLRTTLSEGEREHRFRCQGGKIVITVGRDTPAWMVPTTKALVELLSLPPNWDTYGASRIDPTYIPAVLQLLLGVMQGETPLPAVVPTSRGGIQLEWHTRGIDLEVEFASPFRVLGLYEDLRSDRRWEAELTFDLTPLARAIAQLTERAS